MRLAPPTIAYDLELLTTPPKRGSENDHGWCYGLPPGIESNQWPLSPFTGYPMQPCFTLRIPEQYRTRGPNYIALSAFADRQHDEPDEVEAITEYISVDAPGRPADPDLLPFWTYKLNRHPMEVRMEDAIGRSFAMIWLTEVEFAGPLCRPPRVAGNRLLGQNQPPPWIEKGSARAAFDLQVGHDDSIDEIRKKSWYRIFGQVPDLGYHAYAIESKDEERNGKTNAADSKGAVDKNNNADSKSAADGKPSTTTGQAGAGAKLSGEQRSKITTVIKQQNVRPETNINFSISLGTRVPRTVSFHPLPEEIISVYPDWRGYEFFLVGDQIIVVNPGTFEIVAVLDV
jgi:hypothetical protein